MTRKPLRPPPSAGRLLRAAALAAAALLTAAPDGPARAQGQAMSDQRYVGMWVTADGRVRHELLPNGRYDEARGDRRSAYQGRYTITGDHIDYVDDTGFTADGDFRDGILYHGGGAAPGAVRGAERDGSGNP